jgi:hypothetical protein
VKNDKNPQEMSEYVIINEDKELECPDCESENLIINGRCITCTDCGWSVCSL